MMMIIQVIMKINLYGETVLWITLQKYDWTTYTIYLLPICNKHVNTSNIPIFICIIRKTTCSSNNFCQLSKKYIFLSKWTSISWSTMQWICKLFFYHMNFLKHILLNYKTVIQSSKKLFEVNLQLIVFTYISRLMPCTAYIDK